MNPVILSYLWYHVPDSLDCVMESLGSLNMVHVHAQHLLVISSSFTSITHHIGTPTIDKALHYDQTNLSFQARTQPFRCWYPPPCGILQKIPHYSGKCWLINNVGLHLLTIFLRGSLLQNRYPTSPIANHPRMMEVIWNVRSLTRKCRRLGRLFCTGKEYNAITTYHHVFDKLY